MSILPAELQKMMIVCFPDVEKTQSGIFPVTLVRIISYFAENPLGALAIDQGALSDGFVSYCYPTVNRKLKLEERQGSKLDGLLPTYLLKILLKPR